jgi:hypothetical protein
MPEQQQQPPTSQVPTGTPADLRGTPTNPQGRRKEMENTEKWYDKMAGVIVAVAGLIVLGLILAVAIGELPTDNDRGANIVALTSAGFGVIGAIVGAYFGVRAANRAVNEMGKKHSP